MEPATIAASFSAMRAVISRYSDTPLKAAIIELQGLLVDIQGKTMELQQELHESQLRVRELEEAASQRTLVEWDRHAYWKPHADRMSFTPGGPFCTRCFDENTKLIRLEAWHPHNAHCPVCDLYPTIWPEREDRSTSGPTRWAL